MNIMKLSVWTASLLIVASVAEAAAAVPSARLTVVYQGGRSVSSVLTANRQGAQAKAVDFCQGDEAVLFAFTEMSASSNQDIDRRDGGGAVAVEVTMACSRLDGQLVLDYASSPSPAGAGYHVTPVVSIQLPAIEGAVAVAVFSVDIIDEYRPTAESFAISRRGGSFGGEFEGSSVMGQIEPGAAELFRINISPGGMPVDPPSGLGGLADDPYAMNIYRDLQRFCSQDAMRSRPECVTLARMANEADLDPQALDELVQALRAVSPEKSTAMAATSAQIAMGQVNNVALRVAALMSGTGGGFNTSGLTLAGGEMPFSLGMVGDALNAAATDDNEEKRSLLGGTRWGVWLNGTIGGGEQKRHRGNAGFDIDNWSLTGGVDYRLSDQFFMGGAAGFSHLSSDFDGVRDTLEADGYAAHLYAGYTVPNGLSLDGSLSWMRTRYDMVRYLPAPGSIDFSRLDHLTRGTPDATQYSAAFGVSWYVQRDIWTFAPTVQYEYLKSRIDAFEESGSSLFRLAYDRQSMHTRSVSAGFFGDVSLATDVGTFRPYVRALWYADSGTGAYNVLAHFVEGGSSSSINSVIMAEPDRSYGTAEAGLGFRRPIGTRTVDFNVGVMKVLQFEALSSWAVRFDMRIPF